MLLAVIAAGSVATPVNRSRKLDELDQELIRELYKDGRATWPGIASGLGCSVSTARRRYIALRGEGLLRVVGRVSVSLMGFGIPAIVQFSGPDSDDKRFLRSLRSRDDVRFVSAAMGSAGSVAEFVLPSTTDLQSSLGRIVDEFDVVPEPFVEAHIFTSGQTWLPNTVRKKRLLPSSGGQPERRLTQSELTIVNMLMHDGRIALKEIAAAIRKSESTARRIVERLVEEEILDFHVLVEPSIFGFETEFFIWLEVEPSQLTLVGQNLAQRQETRFLAATAGRYSMVAQVVLKNFSDLYRYFSETLGPVKGIRGYEPLILVDVHKRLGNIVDNGRYTREASGRPGPAPERSIHAPRSAVVLPQR